MVGVVINMRFYKTINGEYIMSIGTGSGGIEITENEYNEIVFVVQNKPQATETTDYNLKTDLTWEAYEIEPVEEDATAEEIVDILTGDSND